MSTLRLTRSSLAAGAALGCVLTRDMREEGGRVVLAKGTVLDDQSLSLLAALPWEELHVLTLEAGDVHERDAGLRLATAAAGPGVALGATGGGQWPLEATHRGLLDVRRGALEACNDIEGLCVYTLYDGQVVDRGETVARAKIVPFVLPEPLLARGEAVARTTGGLVTVRPFVPMLVGAVVQESLGARAMSRFESALGEKVEWFGSTLLPPIFTAPDGAAVADALCTQRDAGAQVIALAGSKPMDPLDAAFDALGRVGATMVRHGVPAHPGSLFWLARLDEVSIVGMPACGLFSMATVFDLVLPRLLSGERLEARDLASLGHGGFLTRDMAFRFPPYRKARERGAVE
ncbi:MAG: hypothetical protein ABIZ91_15960 [Gemmatimonadaceae bacterium]